MKFNYLCLTVIPFFISCSDSSDLESLVSSTTVVDNTFENQNTHRDFDVMPANSANPYDIAGQVYNELYEVYYANDSMSASVEVISTRVNRIAQENDSFASLAGSNDSFLLINRVNYILDNIDSCTSEIIDASLTTAQAKISLSSFIGSLLSLCESEEDYGIIYGFVVDYEDSILSDSTFIPLDKKIILTTTSIARHSVYERKKKIRNNNDPEWDLMVGNIAAPVEGSTNSPGNAILMSLIVGIAENNR
jgi:hypothetical protein